MKNDKHTTAIPEAAITQVHGQIAAAIQALQPYTVALTPHERQTMLKMGDKSLAFYYNVQAAAKDDVPGAKAIFEDLKIRFPGGKRQGGTTETETVTETIKKQVKID
jgi:hypothetical protein